MVVQQHEVRRIGVRELRDHLNEVLREVREENRTVDVTLHGHVVAELRPKQADDAPRQGPASFGATADELRHRWREGMRPNEASPPVIDPEEERRYEERLDQLAQRIARRWPKGLSAVDAVRRDRDAE